MRNVSYCARLLLRRDYGRADLFRFERKPDATVLYCAGLLLRRAYGRADLFRFERKPDATVSHCSELLLRQVYGRADYFVSGGANAAVRAWKNFIGQKNPHQF